MKKRVKENPLMTNGKKNKKFKIDSGGNETNEIRTFAILVIIILVFIGALYGITELLKNNKNGNNESEKEVEVNYDKISVGSIFSSSYNNYYVLVYNSEDSKSPQYATMLNIYMSRSKEKDYKKIYFCDLANKLNSKYYNVNNDNKSNPKAKKVSEFDFSDLTLLEIKNKEIVNYVEDYDNVNKILNK